MALETQVKQEIISEHRLHGKDVGSSQVQIAVLTRRISDLTGHLKGHKKDFSSRRGLLNMVSRRRRLLTYLRGRSAEKYTSLIHSLGLRG